MEYIAQHWLGLLLSFIIGGGLGFILAGILVGSHNADDFLLLTLLEENEKLRQANKTKDEEMEE